MVASKFVGIVLTDGEGVWSDDRWRLTQAVAGEGALPAKADFLVRLKMRAAGTEDWLLLCSLTRANPMWAFEAMVDPGTAISCEVVGSSAIAVHVVGWRQDGPGSRGPPPPGIEEADESEGGATFARSASEINEEREVKRRRESICSAGSTPGSKRTPRLTFNPKVLVAEYVPRRVGISPERGFADLTKMERRAEQRVINDILLPLHPLVKPSGSAPPAQPLPFKQATRGAARAVPAHTPSPAQAAASSDTRSSGGGPPRENLGAAEMQLRMTSLIAAEAGTMAAQQQEEEGGGEDSLERLASDLRGSSTGATSPRVVASYSPTPPSLSVYKCSV